MTALYLGEDAVIRGELETHNSGPWSADLDLPGTSSVEGQTVLSDETGINLACVITNSGYIGSRRKVRVVGGLVDPSTNVSPRSYNIVNPITVATDICASAGTQLSSLSVSPVPILSAWTTNADTLSSSMRRLTQQIGERWDVTDSGQVIIGTDPATVSSPPSGVVLLDSYPMNREFEVACQGVGLRVGMQLGGETIVAVEYTIGKNIRARVFY